jgi:serine protease AprX
MLNLVDRERRDAEATVNSRFDAQRNVRSAQAEAATTLTRMPFQRQLDGSKAQARLDVSGLESQADAARRSLERRQARERLLLAAEFDTLKAKAASYLADQTSSLLPLDAYYNPASDQGSMYNVAKGLGIGDRSPTGRGVKVALIDTGVVDVSGLAQANVTIGPDFSFEDMNPDTRGHDTNGHGTHLAGIIAGRDDAWLGGDQVRTPGRFLGIAPDAELISIKAGTADGTTDVSQVIAGVNWVIRYNQENPANPIRVINLSYGTDSQQDYTSDPVSYAVERAWKAGIVVVVAAGNDGWDASRLTDPASDPYVIAVGALEGRGKRAVAAAYSSESAQDRNVDLVAPGRSVVSLRNPGSWSDQFNQSGRAQDRFVRGSGTSQAAAVVTGAAALLLEQRPGLAPDQVKVMLTATADDLPDSDVRLTGAGALDVGKLLGSKTLFARQTWPASNGSGSLEAARGTSHVVADDGTVFTGEQDVFGQRYASSGWAQDSWTGSRWSGSRWSGSRWSDGSWTGSRWSDTSWSGSRWSGSRWSGSRWSGSRWSGSRWSSGSWTSAAWAGSRWSGFGDF